MPDIPDLLKNYLKFSEYFSSTRTKGKLNLSAEKHFYPTTLLPLVNFILQDKTITYAPPRNAKLAKQIALMAGENQLVFSAEENSKAIRLTKNKETAELASHIYQLRSNECECGGENTFKLLIGELLDNIYQHSEFTTAFIMGEKDLEKSFIELCFFDNGISIPGSYSKQGLKFSHPEAIVEATRGLSTKGEERGRGLPYSVSVVTEGLNGEIMIASGKGAFYKSLNQSPRGACLTYEFATDFTLKGTLVSIRIPFSSKIIDYERFV